MIGRRPLALVVAATTASVLVSGAARAQVAGPADATVAEPAQRLDDDRVHVDVTPDLWGLSIKAKGRIDGSAVSGRIPLGKIIDHLDNLYLGEIDVRKGPALLMADLTHAKITLPGKSPLPSDFRLPISATFLTLAAGWSSGPLRVGTIDARPVTVRIEPFAGATFDDLDAEVRGPQGRVGKLAPSWWSPMVGSRVDLAHGRSSLRLEGYVAGFSHARSGRQALVTYAYRLKWGALRDPTLGGGYRYSRQKRAVDGDSLALKLQGPVVYMTFHL